MNAIKIEEVTPDDHSGDLSSIDAQSKLASENLKKKRPRLRFDDLTIPVEAELNYTRGDASVQVVDGGTTVRYQDEVHSITTLTQQLLGYTTRVSAQLYWTYKDRLLSEIYNEVHAQ